MKNLPMLKKITVFSLISLLISLMVACGSTPNKAPVVERTLPTNHSEPEKPVDDGNKLLLKPNAETGASYVVKRGDTLLRIAFDHGQSYNDLVVWNNLKNPNDIKVDQVLWVSSPDGSGAKTSGIANTPGIEVRSLTPINPATNKTSPRGEKKPYSEAALAELQKNETASSIVVATTKSEPAKPVEKVVVAPVENLDWNWPTEGKVIGTFDDQKSKGLDISGKHGQDVIAAAAGKVIYEGGAMRGYGNMLIIRHANNFLSAYAHNKVNLVKEGQVITKGQKIAEMGNSDSDTVKLHFEVRQAGKPVDPLKFLPAR